MSSTPRSRKDRLSDILTRKDRGVGKRSGVVNVLSNIFFGMVWDLGITPSRWRYLMDEYVSSETQQANNNRRDRTSIRGNLNKEFMRHRMTWKVFCKSLAFLKLRAFRIVVMALHDDGRVTEHGYLVDYSTPSRPIPEEERARFMAMRPDAAMESRLELRPPPQRFTAFDPVADDVQRVKEENFEAANKTVSQYDLFE